jgi:putative ABC transport system permease protein
MACLWRDLRYAVHGLAKDPGFTALAVVALGLGIGASTAIFSVIDNILLNPFPYRAADRLTVISIVDKARADGLGRTAFTLPEYLAIAARNSVFEDIAGDAGKEVLYRMGEGTELFTGGSCTPNTFEFFGMSAFLGRTLTPADYQPGAPPVFVMRYKTWVSRFNADRGVLNKTFVLNGTARTLVGIMTPRFAWGGHDMWMPAGLQAADAPGQTPDYYNIVARLKPGVPAQRAQADLAVIAGQLARQFPRYYPRQFTVKVQSLADYVVGRFQSALALVMAAVGLLLLIGCANVANLMLARSTAREREFAIRVAMGAGRWRLVRQFVVESLALAALGAVFGCLLAWAGLRGLVAAIPPQIVPAEAVIQLNAPALLFALGVAALTALIFGLAPAIHASRQDVNATLRSGGRGVGGGFRRARLRGALVSAEVALSLALLVGAGLLMRSFLALSHQELGLRADHVLMARIPLPADRYKTADQMTFFYRTLVDRLKAQPGVVDASESLAAPPYAGFTPDVDVAGKTHSERWTANCELAGDAYFATLRIPILSGRSFSASEVYDARKLAVVNETFVRKYLGKDNPIGQRVHIPALETIRQPVKDAWFEIVGVARDARNQGPQDPVQPGIWVPFTITAMSARSILVRTANDPRAMLNTLRREVWDVDRGVALTGASSLEDFMNLNTYAQPRFTFLLLAVFAGAGLALAMVGVYSVMAYVTARQTQEIGIRMALGADRASVLTMVVRSGLKLVGSGIAIGLAAALLLGRVIASQLWGISPYDPATLIAVPILLALTGALACWRPARRATMVDPAICLRYE